MKSEDIARYVAGLEEEVKRLQAAQQRPHVGPVTRIGVDRVEVDGLTMVPNGAHAARRHAAQYLAVAAYLDTQDAERDFLVALTESRHTASVQSVAKRALAVLDSERAREIGSV